jgi:hypothetical protein
VTSDQAFVLALIPLLVSALASTLGALQSRQTHGIVNGMQQRKVRAARRSGKRAGRRDAEAAVPAPPPAPAS